MKTFVLIFEIIGTAAFAFSGALTAIRKGMDIFGVAVLGLTTAIGGGIIRDLVLGNTPPLAFSTPLYFAIAVGVSVIVFLPGVRKVLEKNKKALELSLLLSDSAGLGIFTVYGISVAFSENYGDNAFLVIFVAVLTGVGGGVLRDIFAGDRPYIFVKHIYALASIGGAVITYLLTPVLGINYSMIIGFAVIFTLRLLSAHFRWSLPKSNPSENTL